MDAAEGVVEAKRSAWQGGPGGGCYRAAGLESTMVTKRDEHVLGLDTPALGERPFESAADRPSGGGVAA